MRVGRRVATGREPYEKSSGIYKSRNADRPRRDRVSLYDDAAELKSARLPVPAKNFRKSSLCGWVQAEQRAHMQLLTGVVAQRLEITRGWSGESVKALDNIRGGHVISWQRRDVNLPPDPILKLMAVAPGRRLYLILWQRAKSSFDTSVASGDAISLPMTPSWLPDHLDACPALLVPWPCLPGL